MSREKLGYRAAQSAAIGIILVDHKFEILYLNASVEPLLGQSKNVLLGKSLLQVPILADDIARLTETAIKTERPVYAHDLMIANREFGTRQVSVDINPEKSGACLCLRLLPETFVRASSDIAANAAAGFGRLLAHELKNPMAGARGAAQLIAAQQGGEIEELADLIIKELDRARRISDRWVRVGDISPAPFTSINLHQLIRDAIQSTRVNQGIALNWSENFDPSIPQAFGDPDLIFQAILNLLINAVEAVDPRDGRIKISTRYRNAMESSPIHKARLEVRIEDNGPGIDETLKSAILNPFVTSKPAGEGLGLSLVSRIAEIHSGGLEFDSQPGRTIFRLYLKEAVS